MPERPDPVLEIKGLRTGFHTRKGWAWAVDGIDLEILPGETLCVVGESGCGKTAAALSILRLIPSPPGRIHAGTIRFQARDLLRVPESEMRAVRGNRISMVFQEPTTFLNPVFSIGAQIAETLRVHQGLSRRQARQKTVEILSQVGMPEPERTIRAYPKRLSGGMRQRAMIALALCCNPDLLIADEPTTALDVTIQAQILDLMKGLQERFGMAILFISHDLGLVAQVADAVAIMYAGRIVEQAPVRALYEHPRHPYTLGLLQSIPQRRAPGQARHPLKAIPGMVPDPARLPRGCRFQDRCAWTMEVCRREEPPLTWFEEDPGMSRASACWRYTEL